MTAPTPEELTALPCPFCGNAVKMALYSPEMNKEYVHCKQCGIWAKDIALWNRRAKLAHGEQDAVCPYIATSDEGTSYCKLAASQRYDESTVPLSAGEEFVGKWTSVDGLKVYLAPVAQEPEPEQLDAVGRMFMAAAIKSGDEGAVRLAAQLAGIAPCSKCDYIKLHCRCPAPRAPEGYREGMLAAADLIATFDGGTMADARYKIAAEAIRTAADRLKEET